MTMYIGPVETHDSGDYHPPGISGDSWCHMVSDTSLVDLTGFLTTNTLSIGALTTNVRTPLLGSNLTYIGLTSAQRSAAITAGAVETPSDGKTMARAFDLPTGTWEPA